MSEVTLKINDREITADGAMSVLDAARQAGIPIPTLCHHDKLEAYGGCRLCIVEVEARGKTNHVVSCTYPVEQGLSVRTRTATVDRIRRVLIEELMAHAPDSPELKAMAEEYGADRNRFGKEPIFCVMCGLCVRYCAEVKGEHAVGFIENGPRREISFVPERAAKACWDCQECFTVCPTSYAQAAYLLAKGLSFPDAPGGAK